MRFAPHLLASCLAIAALATAFPAAGKDKPVFRAGAATVDISPKAFPRIIAGGFLEGRGDKNTDPLHVRCFVLDDGTMKIAFAIVDTCMMEQALIDEAKALASKNCGIPTDRMMVSATHTHSAPAAMGCLGTRKDTEYGKFLIPKVAEAIVAADKALQPARIGWASVDDWEHTHNRRWIRKPEAAVVDPFGERTGLANMHPGYESRDVVGPSGPVDPGLSVISIQTKDGKPLAVLANYSQHYFGASPVSADYYGAFCRRMAAMTGQKGEGNGPFVCAMSQGTSGDLMWMDYGSAKKTLTMDEYAEAVAKRAMEAVQMVKYQDTVTLGMVERKLRLGYRVPDSKRLAWARPLAEGVKDDKPKDKQEVYAREAVILDGRKSTEVKLQAIRIGELTIATLPNEVYAITGLKLKAQSPGAMHFNIELANGAEGYIPPPEQHVLGGYTTWPARTAGLEVQAEPKMVKTLLGALEEVTDRQKKKPQAGNGPYAQAVLDAKPVAYWRMEEFEGRTLRNAVPEGVPATLTNGFALYLPGVGSGTGWGAGEALHASPFRGKGEINRSVHLAGGTMQTPARLAGEAYSIATWFWLGEASGASARSGTLIDAPGGEALRCEQDAQHRVHLLLGEARSAVDLAADDWHFAVLVRTGDEVRVHVDGREKPELQEHLPASSKRRPIAFGEGMQGKLDEIAVWNRAIQPAFVATLWGVSGVAGDHARQQAVRQEAAMRAQAQSSTQLKEHENWSASLRFRNTKANNVSAVTAYLISRGPKGDGQAPGDHLGIGGNYKDSLPGRLFVYNGNAANQIVRGTTVIEPGAWNTVTLERRGSRVKVLLNGKVEIDAELPVTAPGATELFFGKRCDGFAPLEGEFADVAVTGLKKPAEPAPAPVVELSSPAQSPEESAKKWHVREGYRIELAAAEPVVLDPVAFDWDEHGRLWVVEMADYPLGMDGNGQSGGRVVMLEDTNEDGRYDKRTVIADGLNFPTGILTWKDGALVTAAPDILYVGPTGEKKVLLTGFSTGNQQLRVNGLRWGMDGWVYCAAGAHNAGYNKGTEITSVLTGEKIALGSRDFRFKPDTGEFDPQSGPSQFGRVRDDWGHWFGVQNSFPLWHYVLQDHYLRRNPYVIPPDPVHQLFTRNPPVYPASSAEKRFHSFDQAGRFTSACGIEIYHDRSLFDDGKTHAFTCEPFHNVVQHHVLEDEGVTFKASRDPAESKTDFLASEDHWCRPVMVRTGPEGALWVADMYRYMIEHPQWLPQNGKDELLPHYRSGDDKGRIWRVVRDKGPESTPARSISAALGGKGRSLRAAFESPNGWIRDKAEMLLAWSGNKDAAKEIAPLVRDAKLPQARAQAAWTLRDLGVLSSDDVAGLLADPSDRVREQALIMAEKLESPEVLKAAGKLLNDTDKVKLQLACTLGEWKSEEASKMLASLLRNESASPVISGAAMTSALPHLTRLAALFAGDTDAARDPVLNSLFRCAVGTGNDDAVAAMVSHLGSPSRLGALLAVLDEKGLSLASFAAGLKSPTAQAEVRHAQEILAAAATKVKSLGGQAPIKDLQLLAADRDRRAEVAGLLPAVWENAQAENAAGVLALTTRLQPKNAPDFLLAGWSQKTPTQRQQIIEALLSNDGWTLALLQRIKSNQVEANAFDAAARARLLKHPKPQVQKLAEAVFAGTSTAARAEVLEKFKPALKLNGDPAKGKIAFQQVCVSCHKLDGVGIDLGPDLRSVVQHDPDKLLNSILDPSAVIEPGFMAYHCTLTSGEQLYGVIATETSTSLTLKMPGNVVRAVLRSDIASLKSTNTSLMPDGLEAALTPQSLADLIAYLKQPK